MKTSRRDFIKTGSAAIAGVALLGEFACNSAATKTNLITAVQLYCVRDEMGTDPEGTLAKLAKMGYTHVEHANYVNHKFYGWSAAEFKKVLDDLGLKMPSGHTVLGKDHWDVQTGDFTDAWKKTIYGTAVCSKSMAG